MSKHDLKAAMDSLDVKTALKLGTKRPVFSQPTSATQVTKASANTLVSSDTMVTTTTQASAVTQVSPVTKAGWEYSDSQQASSVRLENEFAGNLMNGFTRIPNRLLMLFVSGKLLRSEMQILLLIARLTISFQRRHAPLSKSVLERQTGLSGPAVMDALAGTIRKGLVEKIPGDQKKPNHLGLVFMDEWDFFPEHDGKSKQIKNETLVTPPTQVSAVTMVSGVTKASALTEVNGSTLVSGVAQETTPTQVSAVTQATGVTRTLVTPVTQTLVSGLTYNKDIKTIKTKLSLSEIPGELREYFSGPLPQKKRESEWDAFENLQADYCVEDIAAAFQFVRKHGVGNREDGEKTVCHSPMAYLSKAMADVIVRAREEAAKSIARTARESAQAQAANAIAAEDAREESLWREKESRFYSAFPNPEARRAKLVEILSGLPFGPDSQVGVRLAIAKWGA